MLLARWRQGRARPGARGAGGDVMGGRTRPSGTPPENRRAQPLLTSAPGLAPQLPGRPGWHLIYTHFDFLLCDVII